MICISITHKNLTAGEREIFSCNEKEQAQLAACVKQALPDAGCVFLMTCNEVKYI